MERKTTISLNCVLTSLMVEYCLLIRSLMVFHTQGGNFSMTQLFARSFTSAVTKIGRARQVSDKSSKKLVRSGDMEKELQKEIPTVRKCV